jgi:hypothetical protein
VPLFQTRPSERKSATGRTHVALPDLPDGPAQSDQCRRIRPQITIDFELNSGCGFHSVERDRLQQSLRQGVELALASVPDGDRLLAIPLGGKHHAFVGHVAEGRWKILAGSFAASRRSYIGELVTLRYDPRDMAEIRVFHHDRFVCRAICPEIVGETVPLREIVRARSRRRRELRTILRDRKKIVDELTNIKRASEARPRASRSYQSRRGPEKSDCPKTVHQ